MRPAALTLDHHRLAAISLTGSLLDVLGALYLAYDILGGENGPLRFLTRAVTYGLLYGCGFGSILGLPFGIAAGVTHGITIGLEMTRASANRSPYPFAYEVLFSAVRGLGYAIGAAFIYGPHFGAYFGVLSTVGQALAYRRGVRPALDYTARRAPRITRAQLLAAVIRTVGYLGAGYLSAALAHHHMHALMFGVEAGLSIGILTALATFITPFVEWTANTIPDRRLGVLGVGLILVGFTLQSLQYWLALFDVPVN